MEYPIKSVTLGGFDKQDVIRYIESSARNAAEERRQLEGDKLSLEKENRALRTEAKSLRSENDELRTRNTALESQLTDLVSQLSDAASQQDGLRLQLRLSDSEDIQGTIRRLEEENAQLKAEAETLRQDAAAYARFREKLGTIECEARERADSLETAATERVRETLNTFYSQYQELIHAVESTASHVTGELRKVEFNLSQLPRAMDQAGRELNALNDRVNHAPEDGASRAGERSGGASVHPASQTKPAAAQSGNTVPGTESVTRPAASGASGISGTGNISGTGGTAGIGNITGTVIPGFSVSGTAIPGASMPGNVSGTAAVHRAAALSGKPLLPLERSDAL